MGDVDSRLEGTRFAKLTARELELLRGLNAYRRTADLATELAVSKETIRTHIKNIRRKLDGCDPLSAAHELASLEDRAPIMVTPLRVMDRAPSAPDASLRNVDGWSARLPFRGRGARGNELSYRQRLIWIGVITIGIAIGLGTVAAGMRFVSDIIGAVVRARQH